MKQSKMFCIYTWILHYKVKSLKLIFFLEDTKMPVRIRSIVFA